MLPAQRTLRDIRLNLLKLSREPVPVAARLLRSHLEPLLALHEPVLPTDPLGLVRRPLSIHKLACLVRTHLAPRVQRIERLACGQRGHLSSEVFHDIC